MTFRNLALSVSGLFWFASAVMAGPLHDAAKAGDKATVERLIGEAAGKGTSVLLGEGTSIDEGDDQGFTALHHAVAEEIGRASCRERV